MRCVGHLAVARRSPEMHGDAVVQDDPDLGPPSTRVPEALPETDVVIIPTCHVTDGDAGP
jgi:hypothetical protein